MDPVTFEQIYVEESMVGNTAKFLKEEMILKVALESDSVIGIEPPNFGIYEITYTEPGVKGDTATNTLKPATLDTGAIVMVPLFVNEGEKIKVDLRTESYSERVK
jgi:elongation factor P